MSAHLSRLRLFQRHLRSLVWVWVWVWDWVHWHTSPGTRSLSSRHPPFTHYPFPPRSLVCGGQTSPHKPRLAVSHSTSYPLSSSPPAHSFVLGTVVTNNNLQLKSNLNLKVKVTGVTVTAVWRSHGRTPNARSLSRSPSSPPPFTRSPFPPRSLVRDGQTSPHRPRLVVSRSTCPPLSPLPTRTAL
jgi:hypothetical protein